MKTEYTVPEVCVLAGLPPKPSTKMLRRLNQALVRYGWYRYQDHTKSSRFVWVPSSPADPRVPNLGAEN